MGQVITIQKMARMCSENVAGNEEKSRAKRILSGDQGLVEVLAIQFGHFHVADDESISFMSCTLESFARVEENVDPQTFILQHVGDEPRNRGFVLQHKNAGASPSAKCGAGMRGFEQFCSGQSLKARPGGPR